MEFKGTPGKWVIAELGEPNPNNDNVGNHNIATASDIKDVAFIEVWFGDNFTIRTKEEAHANAQLIAHAPEMLTTLDKILRWKMYGRDEDFVSEEQINDLLTRATTI